MACSIFPLIYCIWPLQHSQKIKRQCVILMDKILWWDLHKFQCQISVPKTVTQGIFKQNRFDELKLCFWDNKRDEINERNIISVCTVICDLWCLLIVNASDYSLLWSVPRHFNFNIVLLLLRMSCTCTYIGREFKWKKYA